MAESIEIRLYTEEEDTNHHDEEKRQGYCEGFADAVDDMIGKAEGNWGWCTVVVEVRMGDDIAKSYLGQCSYKSAEDFMLNSGYFPQLVEEAIDEIKAKQNAQAAG